jgi:transposase
MVVGMVLDNQGNPVCSELWPGNAPDVKSLVPMVDRLKTRFPVGEVCIVADRGMISAETMSDLQRRNWKYILGVRMRSSNAARQVVARAGRDGRYQEVFPESDDPDDPAPLKVKEVWVAGQRYIVCRNEEQARRDRQEREAIVASLRDALQGGDKSLVGNKGYRRFLQTSGERFTINEQKVKQEARYDGKWVADDQRRVDGSGGGCEVQATVGGRRHFSVDEVAAGNAAHLSQAR